MSGKIDRFIKHIKDNGLQVTRQRIIIAEVFLGSEGHLNVEELYEILQKKGIKAGRATVFRTLKLLSEAGVAVEVDLGDGTRRYETSKKKNKHVHLICKKCNAYIEVHHEDIEKLQQKLCRQHGFVPVKHRLDIFGICRKCTNVAKRKES